MAFVANGRGQGRTGAFLTEIFAGNAGGHVRALGPPARAIVTRQGRDARSRLGRSAAEIERGPLRDAPTRLLVWDSTRCYMARHGGC